MKILSVLVFASLFLGACSGSSQQDSSSNQSQTKKVDSKIFSKKANAICESVDKTAVPSLGAISSGSTTNPGALAATLKLSEDELDRYISKLELVDAPDKFADTWESFIDETAAIRDTYPDLNKLLEELQTLNEQIISGTTVQLDLLDDAKNKQDEVEMILKDLKLRVDELEILAKNMKIDKCSDVIE